MTAIEDLMRAALTADEARKASALRALRGDVESAPTRPVVSGPLLLGMGAAGAYLGVSRPTLWRLIQAGRVEKMELYANSYRIRRADLEALAERRGKTQKN